MLSRDSQHVVRNLRNDTSVVTLRPYLCQPSCRFLTGSRERAGAHPACLCLPSRIFAADVTMPSLVA